MYQDILQELGLSKNEAKIYETLLREGESPVGNIAEKSSIHRRNVYDSLARLIEKGLVFEVLERTENQYQAVDPGKLSELIQEKVQKLDKILPNLSQMYESKPYREELFMYRGTEGWKNYLNDVLRIGNLSGDILLLSAVDVIKDTKVDQYMENFYREIRRKKIDFKVLYRADTGIVGGKVQGPLAKIAKYRVLSKKYPVGAAATVVGDRVFLFSDTFVQGNVEPDTVITVIKNKDIAESFRVIFASLWDNSGENVVRKAKIIK